MRWTRLDVAVTILPLLLFVVALVIQVQSWWPTRQAATGFTITAYRDAKLVATAPDGVGGLQWSKDGRIVRAFATAWDETSPWYPAYFDVATHKKVSAKQGSKAFIETGIHVETLLYGNASDGDMLKKDVLGVCDAKNHCKPLQGTDFNHFASFYANGDPTEFVCHYDSEQLSPDARKIYITSQGTLYVWSARNGHLLSRLPLNARPSIPNAEISRDARLILVNLPRPPRDQGIIAIFDVQTGKRLYALTTDAQGYFLPSGKEFWCAEKDKQESTSDRYSFFDARTGHLIWQCPKGETPFPFASTQTTIFTKTDNEVRLRDTRTGNLKQTLVGPASTIQNMAIAPDGSHLWTSHEGGQIWSWRVKSSATAKVRTEIVLRKCRFALNDT